MKPSRIPFVRIPFRFKRRRTGVFLIVFGFLLILVALIQLSYFFRKSENSHSGVDNESLRKILVNNGEEIQLAYSYDLDWFRRYLTRLRKAEVSLKRDAALRKLNKLNKFKVGKNKNLSSNALNNMDMPMTKVGKKFEPCLKLLSINDLENLTLPPSSSSPITNLKYYSLDDDDLEILDTTVMMTGETRRLGRTKELEFFSGKQSLEDRASSFQIKKEMEVHCGFAHKNSGFDISETDKKFMNACSVVVVTCTFGGGDDIYQPIGITNVSLKQVCFVAFWDDVTLTAQSKLRVAPDPMTHKIGLWRIIVVKNLPFIDQRRNGKIPKMLNHRLFPNARYSLWVDSKSQLRRDPLAVLEALLWRKEAVFAISEHAARSCIYLEGEAIVRKNKSDPNQVAVQLNHYYHDGYPEYATFDGRKALAEASVIIREHTTLTNLFMCLWFNEVVRFSPRDQLSFGYVLKKLNAMHVAMFSACTRHALVNVIGHNSKPLPLSKKP